MTPQKNYKKILLRRILRQKSGLLGAFLILLFLTTAASRRTAWKNLQHSSGSAPMSSGGTFSVA
jgi:hypothetical protein